MLQFFKLAAALYGLVMGTAAGGLVAANLVVLLAMFLVTGDKSSPELVSWMHWGWLGGALLGFVGGLGGVTKVIRDVLWPSRSSRPEDLADTTATRTVETDAAKRPAAESTDAGEATESSHPLSAAFVFGLAGSFAGLMLGASLLLIWFSLSYSPWSPAEWAESIELGMIRHDPSDIERPTATTRHPIAIGLFLVPLVGLGTLGAVVGLTLATIGKLKACKSPERPLSQQLLTQRHKSPARHRDGQAD